MHSKSSSATDPVLAGSVAPSSSHSASKFPAPIYRDTVLLQVFEDAKRYFLDPLLAIQRAHTLMLAAQGIMSHDEAASCLSAVDQLDREAILRATYDGSFEDLFYLVEQRLAAICGASLAGKMHTARSRNDIDLTMYRMVVRGLLLDTADAMLALRAQLLELASTHRASLIPAYTHNQPAQPTTLGHYLMAAVEFLERDHERLQNAYTRVNRSPLGACAITTTGFPIDRNLTAKLLGFQGLQINSYGAIAAVDYLTESCAALGVSMVNLGKLAQDLLQWSSVEFGFIRLSDGYVQISSIMPQKRNPVPLEHVRILSSRALTQAHGVILSLHNTPFTDINDGEDDLQPLAYTAFADAIRSLRLFTGLLSEIELDTDRMAASAHQHFLTVTELADVLVRSTGMDFRAAHEIVSEAVRASNDDDTPETMVRLVAAELGHRGLGERISPQELRNSLDPAHFVAVRKITGGPALEALEPALRDSQHLYEQNLAWLGRSRTHLQSAEQELLRRATTFSTS